jgi:hypothetical protein
MRLAHRASCPSPVATAANDRDTYPVERTRFDEGDLHMSRPILTTFAFLAFASSASAGTISTSYFFEGGPDAQNVCIAINVGKKPLEVTVDAVPLEGGTPNSETCTLAPLAAVATVPDANGDCQAFINASGFCRFTVPGSTKSLRGVMLNRSTAPPFTIHSTSEAR